MRLKLTRELSSVIKPEALPGTGTNNKPIAPELPAFIRAEQITSSAAGNVTDASGDAELRKQGLRITADKLSYNQETDVASATGNVRIAREGVVYSGPFAQIETETGVGFFNNATFAVPRYVQGANGVERLDGGGTSKRVDFIDLRRAVANDTTYSTCRADDMAWQLTASKVRIDIDDDTGIATNAKVRFLGVPILYVPQLSFPLSDKRRSGVLPPLIAISDRSGFEYSQPYYWNIAPNRDATITPTLSTKRGVGVDTEFRYLEPTYKGELRLDWLPSDRVADRSRWGVVAKQDGTLADFGYSNVSYTTNVARVSDDGYWKDFPRSIGDLSQRLLPADFNAAYTSGNLTLSARALKWQTLQDIASPITPPYDIVPQIKLNYKRFAERGFDYGVDLEASRFRSGSAPQSLANGSRLVAAPYVSFPIQTPGYYVLPKLAIKTVRYNTDLPMADGSNTGTKNAGFTVPTFSVDAGATFERAASYFGRNYTQTLEPRVFYVRTPFRNQTNLPTFDSTAYEFSFASIFSDNAFAGNDRVSDSHTLTFGGTSRLIDPDSGAERVRFQLAQRLRLADQNVTLGTPPATDKLSDLLVGATFSPSSTWAFDGTVQYNREISRSVRSVLGVRYSPAPFQTLSAAYRLSRGNLEQVDLAWQWPISQRGENRWYGVGRLNYAVNEKRITDSIVGFEYQACCWMFRAVAQRVSTSTTSASTKLFLQLELSGLGRLGTNPLATLKQNIPQYRVLREDAQRTSPYTNYE